jgi:transposase-like protein
MARYGKNFKERAVARLLPLESAEISRVSQELRVSISTLKRWRADALSRPARTETPVAPSEREPYREHLPSASCRRRGPGRGSCEPWRGLEVRLPGP